MAAPDIWTLEKRLGYGLVAQLLADTGIFNRTFGDRVEYARDHVDIDEGQGPTVLIKPDLPQDPVRKGDIWADTPYHFLVLIKNWDDREQNRSLADAYQMLDAVFLNAKALLETYVVDTEENLASKCGKLEIRHELNVEELNDMPARQARIIVTVAHKRPLDYSVA